MTEFRRLLLLELFLSRYLRFVVVAHFQSVPLCVYVYCGGRALGVYVCVDRAQGIGLSVYFTCCFQRTVHLYYLYHLYYVST